MLIRIETNIKEIFKINGILDVEGKTLKFKNSIKYVELDEKNAEKLKALKLDEIYKNKIKITYDVKAKDRKKDEEELEKMHSKDEMLENLKEEMQNLTESFEGVDIKDITEEYKDYVPKKVKERDEIIKGIISNIYEERKAEIEKEME